MSDGDERGTSERPSEPSTSVSDGDERGTSEPSTSVSDGVEPTAPALRIITPTTTPEEIAAIVAVFTSLGGQEKTPRPVRTWASVARRIGAPGTPRPGAWRTSALPR